MAKLLFKLRFLLVGALALTLLSAPLLTEAGSKKLSQATVLSAANTIAGLSTEIEVEGKSYEPVEVAISKPNGSLLILEAVTDASGEAELTLADYHTRTAGLYSVEARHLSKNEGYGSSKTFEVYPGAVSDTKSEVDLNKSTAAVGETLEMTVSLQDNYGNAIDGHVLKLSGAPAYSPEFATDEDGEMTFYITGERNGIAELTVFDSSANKTLGTKPKIAFLGESDSIDQGGWGDNYNPVFLASESGPIDSFELDMDEAVEAGDNLTVTVTATDEDGLTVEDYTGTVRFSSSDEVATLPNDYTFSGDDLGEHTFSLSVKFITPGAQTLIITDVDQYTIEGEAAVEVLDEGAEYDADFVTEDFEREGDFHLISPTSGSYSADSVEVQGEADYGYYAVIYVNEEEAGRVEIEFDNSFTFTLEDLEDGAYVIYADVVELDEDDEILEVIEESASETITVDTTVPELVSISADAEGMVTVLSEADLEEAYLLFEEEIYELDETATAGKYEAQLVLPGVIGEYTVDVVLMDALGNEVQYRDELTLTVDESGVTGTEDSEPDPEPDPTDFVDQVTGLIAAESQESVILSWEAVEADNTVAFYRVHYGPTEDALYAISDTFDASTSWIITDLAGDQTYFFAVSAIDVEENEGEQSEATLGITLAREGSITDADDVPTGTEDPAITDSELPSDTPDSGPAETALILLSVILSAGYFGLKRANLGRASA
jgi:hypothetical protein